MIKKEKMKWTTIARVLFCYLNVVTLNAQSPDIMQDSIAYNHVVGSRKIIFIRRGCFPCGAEKKGEYEKGKKALARKIIEDEEKTKQGTGVRNYYVVVYCGKITRAGAPVGYGLIFRRVYPQSAHKRKGRKPRRALPPQRV